MSFKVEKLEKNMAKLTIEVSAEKFEKACEKAYQKNKNKINIGVNLTIDELKQLFTLRPDEELVIEYKYNGVKEKNVDIYVDFVDIDKNNNNEDNPFKYNFYGSYELVRSE